MTEHNKVLGRSPALIRYTPAPDLEQCFCDNCWKMYTTERFPTQNHILLAVSPESRGEYYYQFMMPLLRAWTAFLEQLTRRGHKHDGVVTFTIAGIRQTGFEGNPKVTLKEVTDTKEILGPWIGFVGGRTIGDKIFRYDTPRSIFEVNIKDVPVYSGALLNEDMLPKDSNYAHTSGGSAMLFKSGVLKQRAEEYGPGFALAIMVHEFTAHRFDKVWEVDKWPLRLNDNGKRPHYTDPDGGGHCGNATCLNAFIDAGRPNHQKLAPFFRDFYNKYKNHQITMSEDFFKEDAESGIAGMNRQGVRPRLDMESVDKATNDLLKYMRKANIPGAEITIQSHGDFYFELYVPNGRHRADYTADAPLNFNIHLANPSDSREHNDAAAVAAGAPIPACKYCGNYHDPQLACPIPLRLGDTPVEPEVGIREESTLGGGFRWR